MTWSINPQCSYNPYAILLFDGFSAKKISFLLFMLDVLLQMCTQSALYVLHLDKFYRLPVSRYEGQI